MEMTALFIIIIYYILYSHYKYLSKNNEKLFGRVMSGLETATTKANFFLNTYNQEDLLCGGEPLQTFNTQRSAKIS